jgi:antitoxin YefM
MYVISSREFRENQKMYLDLVDKNEQVIVQRGKNKAYKLTAITDTDRYLEEPAVKDRLAHSLAQADQGDVTTLRKEDINDLPGL